MVTKPFLHVFLPASLATDAQDLRQKTLKVGVIGRVLGIFRVSEVVIFNDDDPNLKNQTAEAELLATLLRYMETPQYLRKALFKRTGELSYAGLLAPLRTPHHPLESEKTKPGDYREAVVIKVDEHGSLLEIGLHEKGFIKEKLRAGERFTVRLGKPLGDGKVAVTRAAKVEISEYWGYEVKLARSLADGLKEAKVNYVIGTSRHGQNLYEAASAIKSSNPSSAAVVFGGPYAGLFEICKRQRVDAKELFDVVVNTIPEQGVATVRTEEALLATLALLNALVWG